MKKIMALGLALAVSNAWAGGGGFAGASEVTQLMNNAELGVSTGELIVQTAEMAQQTYQQIQQLNYIKERLTGNGPWLTKAMAISDLRRIVVKGDAIAAGSGNAAADAANKILDYSVRCGASVQYGVRSSNPMGGIGAAKCSGNEFKKWRQTNRDTIKNTIEANDISASQFESEESTTDYLNSLNDNAAGQTAVTQVGNRVAIEQTKQLQELRKMQIAQNNAINSDMLGKNEEADHKNDVHRQMFESSYQKGSNVRYFTPGAN
jgi:P-type conjugative transfer protein TrbJ